MRHTWPVLACALASSWTITAPTSAGGAATASRTLPLIGVNFSNYGGTDCQIDGAGVVATYDRPGVRARVLRELAVMHRRGIESVRLLLWHTSRWVRPRWGIVPAPHGSLVEPYRANLARYVSDLRRAGFRRLTVSFAPMLANEPGLRRYDPATFWDNWGLVREVRAIVERDGPSSTRFDLLNEGAPNPAGDAALAARRSDYLVRLYRLYVHDYGRDDVVISANAGRFPPDQYRIAALLRIFERSGVGFPRWFEIHVGYRTQDTLAGLRLVDRMLARQGLRQPLVIGEAPYDDAATATAIHRFAETSSRPVEEVIEWPLAADRPCRAISVAPPYHASAYQLALRHPAAP
jgi:hypothetical protein